MNPQTPVEKVLLAIDLATVTRYSEDILPIIDECGAHEVGTFAGLYVMSFPDTPEGVIAAADCAQRIHLALPKEAAPTAVIHFGDPRGAGLAALPTLRKAAGPGGLSVSQEVVDLGEGRLPIALEQLEDANGPTGIYVMARTRFIEVPLKPAGRRERTRTRQIYARTSATPLGVEEAKTQRQMAEGPSTSWASGAGNALARWATGFGFKAIGAGLVLAVLLNLSSTRDWYDRAKSRLLGAGPATAMTEKAATRDIAAQPPAVSGGTTAAAGAHDESALPSELESAILSKCQADPELCHTSGLAALKDARFAVALRFFSQACDAGLVKSCSQASAMYQNGMGVERSPGMARDYLEKACLKNDGPSCTELGLAYLQGDTTRELLMKARAAIDRGCELGHGTACLLIGLGALSQTDGAARPRMSSAAGLAKGCELMKIPGCSSAGSGAGPGQ